MSMLIVIIPFLSPGHLLFELSTLMAQKTGTIISLVGLTGNASQYSVKWNIPKYGGKSNPYLKREITTSCLLINIFRNLSLDLLGGSNSRTVVEVHHSVTEQRSF